MTVIKLNNILITSWACIGKIPKRRFRVLLLLGLGVKDD